ncbi:MAG: exodeoxyribonuclease VII small subunit [Candidatus Saccharimonadales bacterium]
MNKKTKEEESSYSELKKELNDVLERLQSDNLDIDEAMELYERGLEVITILSTQLKEAENTIKKLNSTFNEK